MESNNGPRLRTPKPSLNSVYGMYLHVPQHTRLPDGRTFLVGTNENIHPTMQASFFTCVTYKDVPAELFEQVIGVYVSPEDNARWGEGVYEIGLDGALTYIRNNWDSGG